MTNGNPATPNNVAPQTYAYQAPAPAGQQVQPQQSQSLPGVVVRTTATNKAPMLLVEAFEKTGKCLRKSTTCIDPRKGRLVTIGEIVESLKSDAHVLTKSESSLLDDVTPTSFHENPPQQLYRLRTQTGFEIEATANHEFMTQRGWVALEKLDRNSDRVMTVAEYPQEIFWRGSSDDDDNWIKVLAYLIADGNLRDRGSPSFTKNEAAVREDFIAAVEALGDVASVYVDTNDVAAVRLRAAAGREPRVLSFIREAGLDAHKAGDKFIPSFVFGMQKAKIALFLNRLFTCDGSVEASGKISYSSKSRLMMQQIRHLLARFGVVCTMRDKFFRGELYGAELMISSRANVVRFVDEIGLYGEKGLKADRLRAELAASPASARTGDETQIWRHGPYIFDRITSIETTTIEPTYDITIDGTHNFIANDFVVHNSTVCIKTLKDYPVAGKHPLVVAWDDSGPDSCIRAGYTPHVLSVRDFPCQFTRPSEKARAIAQMLMFKRSELHDKHGAIVIDCLSTMSNILLEEARKHTDNSDGRSHYRDMMTWGVEFVNRIIDLGMPNVWLTWLSEAEITEERDASGKKRKRVTMQGGVELPGKKFRKWVAGKADHILILERQPSMVGMPGADTDGFIRQFHTQPWDNINAGGRYSHLLTEPAIAHMGYILYAISSGTPLQQLLQGAK